MAESNPYKFALSHDDMDPGYKPLELRKALDRLTFEDPESYGGKYYAKDSSKRQKSIPQFVTHSPPDLTSETHIFAVLGVQQADAAPQHDGWFVSDFFAFWNLFHGVTSKRQTWLHGLDLDTLVKEHGQYLHGNPYKERKVVLNQDLLDKAQEPDTNHQITRVPPTRLKAEFMKRFVATCKEAAASDEQVLLLIFAHGAVPECGVYLGQPGTFHNSHRLQIKALVKGLQGVNAKITLLTTACYSGGWVIDPRLQLTGFTATGHTERDTSRSWSVSGSSGRFCGSIFASNIAAALTKGWIKEQEEEEEEEEGEEENEFTELQGMSMSAFNSSVYQSLLEKFDKRGYEHNMYFSAEDDTWSMHWRQRTGIPLADYAQRWSDLPTYPKDPTLHPGCQLNRDPTVSQELRDEFLRLEAAHVAAGGGKTYKPSEKEGGKMKAGPESALGKRKASSLFGGSVQAMKLKVLAIGGPYMQVNGSLTDQSGNQGLHSLLFRIFNGQVDEPSEFESALIQLEYRMSVMAAADRYLELMEIDPPHGVSCFDWDQETGRELRTSETLLEILRKYCDLIFPQPLRKEQGYWFSKGLVYVSHAVKVARLPDEVVDTKFGILANIIKEDIQEQTEIIKEIPEVKSKRRKVWQALGKVGNISPIKSRSQSPTKRRSRGQSDQGLKENVA